MASYRGSGGLSLLQSSRAMPAVAGAKLRSRAFCGNNININRAAAPSSPMKIQDREGMAAAAMAPMATPTPHRRTRISAAVSEPPPSMELELAPAASLIDRWLPEAAKPYALLARLDKPDATWLYLWPSIWGVAMATTKGQIPDIKLLALFALGSIAIRGAACTVNDLWDQDFDKQVTRSKTRPLASGALTTPQGFSFLVFQTLLWLACLTQVNHKSFILGAASLVLYFSYPLMKRITYWPQAYLGFAMNSGLFFGWAAVKQSLDYSVLLPAYFAGICWTLLYDTIYAHQDRKDDLKAGVKSTAVMFGDSSKYWLSGFGAATIGSLALAAYNAHLAWPFYPFLAAAAGHIMWQISTVDLSSRLDCSKKFNSNKWFGGLIFAGILSAMLAP